MTHCSQLSLLYRIDHTKDEWSSWNPFTISVHYTHTHTLCMHASMHDSIRLESMICVGKKKRYKCKCFIQINFSFIELLPVIYLKLSFTSCCLWIFYEICAFQNSNWDWDEVKMRKWLVHSTEINTKCCVASMSIYIKSLNDLEQWLFVVDLMKIYVHFCIANEFLINSTRNIALKVIK